MLEKTSVKKQAKEKKNDECKWYFLSKYITLSTKCIGTFPLSSDRICMLSTFETFVELLPDYILLTPRIVIPHASKIRFPCTSIQASLCALFLLGSIVDIKPWVCDLCLWV